MDIKKVLRQDWPWANDKLHELVAQGALNRDEEERFRDLMLNLHNRPLFCVPDSWNADWEMLPDALQAHILSFIQDPGLERGVFTDDDPEDWPLIENARPLAEMRALMDLRLVNKAFGNHFEWLKKVVRDDEISPKVSAAVFQFADGVRLNFPDSFFQDDDMVTPCIESIRTGLTNADSTNTQLYMNAFRRNVRYFLPLLPRVHRWSLIYKLITFFGAPGGGESAAGKLKKMLLEERAMYEAANP